MSVSAHISLRKKCRRLVTDDKLILLVEFAKKLNYSPITIRRFINRYHLKAYKIGGKWYLRLKDVARVKKLLRG